MGAEIIAGKIALEAIKWAIKKDRKARYRLNTPWTLPRVVIPIAIPDYEGTFVSIHDSIITILPYDDCDGATLAPDKIGTWSFVEAAIVHDALYLEMENIAAAWGWKISRVRKLMDDIFYRVATNYAPSKLASIYWSILRPLGKLAHAAGKLMIIAAALCMIGGCVAPVNLFDPNEPFTDPDYTKIAMNRSML